MIGRALIAAALDGLLFLVLAGTVLAGTAAADSGRRRQPPRPGTPPPHP